MAQISTNKTPLKFNSQLPPQKRVIDWKMILSFDMKRHFLTSPIEYVKLRGCMNMNMLVFVLKMKEFFASFSWIFFSDPHQRDTATLSEVAALTELATR